MNVVFDLGGVVVTWEPDALIAGLFSDPAVQAKVRREILEHDDWRSLDRGTLNRQDAVLRGAKRTGLPDATIAELLGKVPTVLLPIADTVDLLHRVKSTGHRLFCLSNMHTESIKHLEREYDFWDVFDGNVISCRINLIKPEPEIYAHLLEEYRLDPEETVFIDDMKVNLEAAAQFGIRTVRFENPMQCAAALKILGCL